MKIWSCKIGMIEEELLPNSADSPMRNAVEEAYYKLTGGRESNFCFSGWDGALTESERKVVVDAAIAEAAEREKRDDQS